MKTIKLSLVAVVIAVISFTAFAFNPNKTETTTSDPSYHWFEVDSNNYLGVDTKNNIQNNYCGPVGSKVCARAYVSISGTPGNEIPIGSPVNNTTRQ
ncbi:MAG TPA: hypothetical protein PK776_06605 [Flavobacterium sp.]|nr:hypothetical protein [Flavobacterium sp.]